MRFERLAVPAYGPFTRFLLELPAAGADFHLIYGPNEAGKSSLLRAIRDLLYGIHGQTPDNFLHDYKALRIGGTIADARGRRLSFQRRKGNRNTLLDGDDSPLPDEALAGFLGVVDRDFFTTVFGLGSEELRRGAESLLHGQGELGQALFSASLAGTPVHLILGGLDAEARAIFSGRARTSVSLRPAVSGYEEELRLSRDATVRPEAWDDALKALADARGERDGLDAELKAHRTRRDWLQRCLDVLPILGRLGEQEQRLDALPALPDLGAAFVATAEAAMGARDGAQAELRRLTLRMEQLEARVGENRPRAEVLARAAEIESAHQQLAVYRQWRNERVGLETDLARSEAELRAGMRQLGVGGEPEAVEALRVRSADELALAEAAGALDEADKALAANRDEADRLRRELDSIEKRLAALPPEDVSALRAALSRTAGAAEAAKGLSRKETELKAARASLERRHRLLAGAPADPRAAFDLPVPAAATLRRFDAESTGIDRDRARAEDAMAESEKKLRRLGGHLERLERRGALPTLDALREARGHRDWAWERVLAAWKGHAEEGELDGRPLADAYPLTVEAADRIGDRLREDAEAVAQAEELRLQLREAETAKSQAQADLGRAHSARVDWEGRWGAAWSPCRVTPLSPTEMLEWRDAWTDFRAGYEAWETADAELAGARTDIASALALLAPLLPEAGDRTLPGLRAEAERRVRKADEAQGARSQLQAQAADQRSDLQRLDAARAALAEALEAARAAWRARCSALGLPVETGTGTVLALLEQRKHLVASLDAWTSLGRAVDGKRQAIAGYEADVHALADALGLPGGAVEVREGALWSELETARARQTRQAQAQADLEAERAGLPQVSQTLAVAEREVADCIAASSASDEAALKTLLADLKAQHGIEGEVGHLRETLHVAARGEPLDDFIARVRAEPADALTAEREGLDQAIQDLEGRRDRAVEHLARAEEDKARLEQSGDEAAEHLQTALNTSARIRHEAARYLRLQLAMHFLREQIERFRRENQAPLLARAGELFRTITEGSFDGLGTDFVADDTPLLVGVREGEKVLIQGMSDGTRDQLYLALRLAAIERHQAHHEPMPVILDDLLVTFDDRRARAILPLLSDLGGKTQVMLFTHHRHLIDLARGALPESGFHLHELRTGEGG